MTARHRKARLLKIVQRETRPNSRERNDLLRDFGFLLHRLTLEEARQAQGESRTH